MMQDRTGLDELPLTQDSLAGLLGGGRPHVNRTLAALEGAGLVRRRRGHIRLLARGGLEHRACDCYHGVFRLPASR
jgi:predicted transcriptional regulator